MASARKADLELDHASDPKYFVVRIRFREDMLLGKHATLRLDVETKVKDGRAVDDRFTVHQELFVIDSMMQEIRIPRARVRHYSYAGRKIRVEIYTTLVIDDAIIFDTTIDAKQEIVLGLRPPGPFDSLKLVDPEDAFDFLKNLKAVPPLNRVLIYGLGLLIAGYWIGMLYVLFLLREDAVRVLIFGTFVGGFFSYGMYSIMRYFLRAYVNLRMKRLEPIRRNTRLRIADLFEGTSYSAVRNCTLRVIAYNAEYGQYKRGHGTKERTVDFNQPVRVLNLYEKNLDIIPRDRRVERYFQDEVDFSEVFRCLYPNNMTSITHGLALEWEIQLLHPEYQDIELRGRSEDFMYDDFLSEPGDAV